jgi:hypothetical protein
MKKRIAVLVAGLLLIGSHLYAGNGDLIVNGNVGVGTTAPTSKTDIRGIVQIADDGATPDTASYASFGISRAASAENNSYIGLTRAGSMVWGFGISGDNSFIIGPPSWPTKTIPTPYLTLTPGGLLGLGTTNPGTYRLYVNGSAYSTGGWQGSDIRLKKNLEPINQALNKVLKLEGVSFEWKTEEYKDKGFDERRHYGVIAQQVEKVLPEVVKDGPDGTKAVAYTEIIPVLIEAMKEQQQEIEQLKKKMAEMH